jgi:hypothetical protein
MYDFGIREYTKCNVEYFSSVSANFAICIFRVSVLDRGLEAPVFQLRARSGR